ncbi:MAG: cupin domain-containing protein [Solirubrobacterales bacterium]|nr:cupin domain-containing protein [Solirubrobacterales bacterium]
MEGELLHLGTHEAVRVLRETEDELEVEGFWTPGAAAPPPHLHPSQDEYFEVYAGSLDALIGGAERHLAAGEAVKVPRGVPHKMWNASNADARALWRTQPALRTIDWFRSIDRLSQHGARQPPIAQVTASLDEYRDVFRLAVGPRPLWPLVSAAFRLLGWVTRR